MTVAWRVVPRQFAEPPNSAFDGEGARLFGGRWNSPGTAVVYAAETLSLAVLELIVHSEELSALADQVAYRLELPDSSIEIIDPMTLTNDWLAPIGHPALRAFGDAWAKQRRSLALQLPSAVLPLELNCIINPEHPDFRTVAIGQQFNLPIDSRLLPRKKLIETQFNLGS